MTDAGYDPARLPPGQYLTEKWPVLHAGDVPDDDLATWDFRSPARSRSRSRSPGTSSRRCRAPSIKQDIHCVTRWSSFDTSFEGVHWRELAKLVRPKPSARFAIAHAEQGFTANSRSRPRGRHALLAYAGGRRAADREHGWPLRLFVPHKYFWKSAKWLRGLELSAEDKPGFWERYGYHNDADHWQEQRYQF